MEGNEHKISSHLHRLPVISRACGRKLQRNAKLHWRKFAKILLSFSLLGAIPFLFTFVLLLGSHNYVSLPCCTIFVSIFSRFVSFLQCNSLLLSLFLAHFHFLLLERIVLALALQQPHSKISSVHVQYLAYCVSGTSALLCRKSVSFSTQGQFVS